MPDLRTRYLGLELAHPVVASASPLSGTLDGVRRLEDAGAAAIVLPSLFEEHIRSVDRPRGQPDGPPPRQQPRTMKSGPMERTPATPDEYLELVRRARESVSVPIIGSLNGVTDDGWTTYARSIQEAGADALELNIFHVPASTAIPARQVEQLHADIVFAVRSATTIPLAVKILPFFSSLGEMVRRLVVTGADGVVLFNRFYQPDFDLDSLQVVSNLELSRRSEIRLPLLWIAILHGQVPASLAASTGVQTAAEVVKYLLAGADVAMTTSALLRHGPEHIGQLVEGLRYWLQRQEYASVTSMRGLLSQQRIEDPTSVERASYVSILQSYGGYRR